MKKEKRTLSLRRQMLLIVLTCWLVPAVMVLAVAGRYLVDSVGQRSKENLSRQFQMNLAMCADRMNSAAEASRLASYDPTIREAWRGYRRDGNYAALYQGTRAFLNRQYGADSRFLYSVFWFAEDPEHMMLTTVTGTTGTAYTKVNRYWPEDFPAVRDLAEELDTGLGFLKRDDRVYLVRNLVDMEFRPIGVLVLALNQPYYFEELGGLSWASAVEVQVGEAVIPLRGELPGGGRARGMLTQEAEGEGYRLTARAAVDYNELLSPVWSYLFLVIGMGVLLIPVLMFTVRFLRRKVTEPIAALMDGAWVIEQGTLGHQIEYQANSQEFQYLTDSFNRMSGQLRRQFDRLYQEELALRDAHIKALQAHINPHFLNNTLEIINWEARMSGDAKVSKMIESLSTVLDAALDRKKTPEVRLAEEMTYVNAYLYIIDQRFGKRLTVTIDLPDELMDCKVPRLILQPVIENAVEHGMGPGEQGEVVLRGRREEGFLILEIENVGGLSEQDKAHIDRLLSPEYDATRENSGNIGISNVNTRLRILYGPECGLSITCADGRRVVARLKIADHSQQN